MKFFYYFNKLISGKYSFRFLLGAFLYKTKLCYLFHIEQHGFILKFYPSMLSLTLWVEPEAKNHDIDFLSKYLKRGDVFIDIGANIGQLSLQALQIVKDKGKVISIEPHPKVFSYLRGNVEINNNLDVIKLFNCAVGSEDAKILFTDKVSDDQNRINLDDKIGLTVDVKTLDSLLDERLIVDILKIDVEGFEYFVLMGSEQVLKRTKYVYYEAWEEHFSKFNYNTSDILTFLEKRDFSNYQINSNYTLTRIPNNYRALKCENLFSINNNL